MRIINVLVQTIGGLGIFVLGMKIMTEGLQMSAGKKIKMILSAVSSNRAIGCLTGAGVTAVVQSSSATTVMLIGFVTAGLMTLHQAVGVILGANIGTTVTAQLIAFKLSKAALPAIAVGVLLKFFTQKKKYRYTGDVILGFGLLFFGMDVMKNGLSPIKSDPDFIAFFTKFNADTLGGTLLCVAVGTLLTVLVQSSSATIGLTMALATQSLVTFPAAMALVLGENIGTTITAQLATIGSGNTDAHRAANSHTLFNAIGVLLMLLIFPFFLDFITFITMKMGTGPAAKIVDGESVNIARYIANGHTLFNVVNAVIFLIFMPLLVKVVVFLSPGPKEPEDTYRMPRFDDRFIDSPIAALAQARGEIIRMATVAIDMFQSTLLRIEDRDLKKLSEWTRIETFLDDMQREITAYLTRVYQGDLSETAAKEISSLMRMTNNIERIGDSVENIAQLAENIIENNVPFTPAAMADIKEISARVVNFLNHVSAGIQKHAPNFMEEAVRMENEIDAMREEMRDDHLKRLRAGDCQIDPGFVFIDLLSNFEKMGDYCFNIAEAVAGLK